MNASLSRFPESTIPSSAEAALARASSQALARLLKTRKQKRVRLKVQPEGSPEETVTIPATAL